MENISLKKFIPAIIAVICLIVLWSICPICFQNNDDKVIMYLTAGYTTGTPELGTVFGGFLWSGLIGIFYRIYSGIAWYTVLSLVVIALSLIVIFYSIYKSVESSHIILRIAPCFVLFIGVLMYFMAALQYTVTAAIVGCGAVCALVTYLYTDIRRRWLVISIVLLICSFSIRKQIGWVSFSAALIVGFFALVKEVIGVGKVKADDENNSTDSLSLRQIIIAAAAIIIAFAIVYVSNAIYEKASGIADFNDYYAEAGNWIDYPHLDIADDTEGVYESVGWDQELYDIASRWYFMDERLTTENFAVINSGYSADSLTVKEYIKRTIDLMQSSPICNVQLAAWIVILVAINGYAIINRQFNIMLCAADSLFVFCMLILAYFCILQGRFPMRVYEALLIIYMIPSVLMLLIADNSDDRHKYNIIFITLGCLFIAGSFIAFPSGNMLKATYAKCHDADRTQEIAEAEALESYAIVNSDNIYVYDYELSLPSDVFTTYIDGVPSNVLFWGGWTYNTPMYYSQLAANGRDSIYAEDFIDGNIYLCGRYVDDTMTAYMQSLFPDAEPVVVDEFDGIVVYQYTIRN